MFVTMESAASSEEAGSTGISFPGSSAGETSCIDEENVADSSPKTSQDILGRFVEDWLETHWTKKKPSPSNS